MAMELQLSTSRAQAELRAVEALVQRLGVSLNSVSATGGLFTGASQGTNQFAGAMTGALNSIRGLNTALSTLSNQVQGAAGQMNMAAQAAANFANNANNAGGAAGRFGNALGGAHRLLSAFGISLGAIGFARFAKDGYDMVNVFESFKTVVGATAGGAKVAEAELEHIRKTSLRLKIDIESTTAAYGKFLAAQAGAGQEASVSRDQFTRLSEVFRVMGLTADRTKLAFLAIEQMVSKGSVSMEELRRQLGESVPAFGILAQSMGVTTKELDSMIRKGGVLTSDALPKLVDGLHSAYVNAESMERALKKPVSTMTDLSNSIKVLSFESMDAFFQGATNGFTALAEALRSDQMVSSLSMLGMVAGQALGILSQGLALAAQNAYITIPALTAFVTLVGFGAVAALAQMSAALIAAAVNTARFAAATIGMAALNGIIAGVTAAWRGLALVIGVASVAMGPYVRLALVAAAAGTALAVAFGLMTSSASAAEGSMSTLGSAAETVTSGMQAATDAILTNVAAVDTLGLVSGRATAEQLGLDQNITLVQDDFLRAASAAGSYSGQLDGVSSSARSAAASLDDAASSARAAKSAMSGGSNSWSDGTSSL